MKKFCTVFLIIAMLLSMLPATALAAADREKPEASGINARAASALVGANASANIFDQKENAIDPDQLVRVIVLLDDSALPTTGLPTKSAQNKMAKQQLAVQQEISEKVLNGGKVAVENSYHTLTNGFSTTVTYAQFTEIRKLNDVKSAFIAPYFEISPDMTTSNSMIGGGLYNETGFTGEGMVIAILDTGVDLSHEIFAAAPSNPALKLTDIQNALNNNDMNCEKEVSGIGASTLYHSAKIPFQFDYGDKDSNGNPSEDGDHGTHVASTAAGNAGVVDGLMGVAPQAQILNMKVFQSSGGASYDDIVAALEDCLVLGVDIVNMSLGSACGFIDYESQDEWTTNLINVFNRVGEEGIAMAVAVGNDYSAAYNNNYGGSALASNPDYGNASEPATYDESLAVAAVENSGMLSPYITVGGRNIAYYDGYDGQTSAVTTEYPFRSLATGSELDYVMIDGYGTEADYAGLDLTGKIAVVARGGGLYYELKSKNAAAAGAIGLVVYNNEPGMVYMSITDWTIPVAFISQNDGAFLRQQAAKKLTIAKKDAIVTSPVVGMCDFSSWGATSELTLKPEITAPGGNIYAAVPGNQYELMSGTSMASPHVAGAMAIVSQAIKAANPTMDAATRKDLVDTKLMSTAALVYDDTTAVSPRKQGAGLINVNAAVQSDAYLTVPGMERPKMELGDDVAKTGVYTLNFTVHNTGTMPLSYKVSPIVLTDGTEEYTNEAGNVKTVMSETAVALEHTFTTNYTDNLATVPANGSADVTIVITLTNPAQQLAAFENGAYVEGFACLEAVNADGSENDDGYDLHAPFLAFYGDWTKAPIIDGGFWWEELDNEYTDAQVWPNEAIVSSMEGYTNTFLGGNNYDYTVPYLADRNAISPNNDDFMDSLTYIYTGMLRSARTLRYTITGTDGTVYYEKALDYETKSVYNSNYYSIVPAGAISDYGDCIDPWFGTDAVGSSLPNGTKATVTIETTPIYDAHASANTRSSWSFPITIDTEAPEVLDMTVREAEGRYYATLSVHDNEYVAAVVFTDSKYSKEFETFGIGESQPDQTTIIEDFDITGMGESIGIIVDDYAGNSKTYYLRAPGNTDDYADVAVTDDMVLYKETFDDNWLPEGWSADTKSNSVKTWYRDEYNWAAIDYDADNKQDEWLISKPYDISGQSTPTHMIFKFETSYTFCVQYPHFNVNVYITKDDGATWESIWNLRESGLFTDWTTTQAKVIIPDEYQGCTNVRFAYVYTGDKGGANYAMNDVIIYKDRAEDYIAVTATAGENGTISPLGRTLVKKGNSKTFTVTPETGYQVEDVLIDGKSVGPVGYYTFEQVGVDHTISATFAPKEGVKLTVLSEATAGGTITPSGKTMLEAGANQIFSLRPEEGYRLVSLRVNGRNMGKLSNYTLENVTENYYVLATFEEIPATPEVIFEQDFEDEQFAPEGWTVQGINAGQTWQQYSYYYLKTKNAYITSDYTGEAAQDEYLISPTVNLGGSDKSTLEFDFAFPYYGISKSEFTFELLASTDGGTTWTSIWNAEEGMPASLSGYVVTDRAFVELPSALRVNGVCFAWHYVRPAGDNSGIAAIDNVKLEATNVTPEEGTFSITATAGVGGKISPSGKVTVDEGTDKLFTITPDSGYEVDNVKVDGVSVGKVTEYTFRNITKNHMITVSFRLATQEGVFFENDFEDATFPSRGWSVKSTDTGFTWTQSGFTQLNATKTAKVEYDAYDYDSYTGGAKQDEYLISPAVDLTGNTAELTFAYAFGRYELFAGGMKFTVEASKDGGKTWTVIWNAADLEKAASGYYQTGSAAVDIPAEFCTVGVQIAFHYFKNAGDSADSIAVDDVKLAEKTSCSHETTEVRDAAAATCTEDGYTGDTYCTVCGEKLASGTVIPALGHDLVHHEGKAATCTETGWAAYDTCSRCDYSTYEELSALGHDLVHHEGKAATCTETGWAAYDTCSRCDYTTYMELSALGHSYVKTETYTKYVYTCSVCGSYYTEDKKPCEGGDTCPGRIFTDMPDIADWSHKGIDFVVENKLFYGVKADVFAPEGAMTRAMLVTVLWRMEDAPAVSGNGGFTDVPSSQWYAKAVAWAAANGIVYGVSETRFAPDDNITREQMATILYRYAEKKGYDCSERGDISSFPDRASISSFATDALSWSVAEELVFGDSSGRISPKNNATRAQVAAILMRFIQNVVEKD